MSFRRCIVLLVVVAVAGLGLGDAEGKRKKRRPRKTTDEQKAAEANKTRAACELFCTNDREKCADGAAPCDQKQQTCKEQCFNQYLANLPEKKRAEVLKEIEEAQRVAEEARAREEALRNEAAALADAVKRAESLVGQVDATVKEAHAEAESGCNLAREWTLPEPHCASADAKKASAEARAAAAEAGAAADSKTATAASDRVQAALGKAQRARDAARAAKEEVRRDIEAEKQRRAEEVEARKQAASSRMWGRNYRAGKLGKRDRKKKRRRVGWISLGLGGAAAIGSYLFYRAEHGRYDAIEAGDLATLEELRGARDDARLYNRSWVILGAASAVGIAVGVPLILTSRSGGGQRVVAIGSSRFSGLAWTGTWP